MGCNNKPVLWVQWKVKGPYVSDYVVGPFQVGLFFCPFGRVWHPCVVPLHSIIWSVHTRILLGGRKRMSPRDQCGMMYNTAAIILLKQFPVGERKKKTHTHIYI